MRLRTADATIDATMRRTRSRCQQFLRASQRASQLAQNLLSCRVTDEGGDRVLDQSSTFLHSMADSTEAVIVLFGIPMDYTVCYRPGARFGPAHIRLASRGLEHYSLQFHESIQNRAFHDAGDLVLPFGNTAESLQLAETYAQALLAEDKIPFALGGEHLVSLPLIRAAYHRYPDLHVIHIDAHADLADVYFGESVTHATVMRRVLDFLPHQQFAQFGIRSADRDEALFALKLEHHPFEVAGPLQAVIDKWDPSVPIYVTVDIDVLDPAFAPGTGTPEAGGITPQELFRALGLLRGRNIIGVDLVEVAPALDPTGCTAVLAAKVVREMLITLCEYGQMKHMSGVRPFGHRNVNSAVTETAVSVFKSKGGTNRRQSWEVEG